MGNKPDAHRIDFNDPRLEVAIANWNLTSFLDDYKVDYIMEGKNVGRNFIGVSPCPFCGDDRYHFAIHSDEKFGSCFICKGYAHPIKIVSYFGRMNWTKAFDYLIQQVEENLDLNDRVKQALYYKKKQIKRLENYRDILPSHRLINKKDIEKIPAVREFFQKRKLHLWHVDRYKLGLSLDPDFRGFIMWPLLINDHPVSYQMRHLGYKRYHNGTHLDKYIFNEGGIIDGHPIILVEGFLDFVNVDSYIRSHCHNRVCCVTGGLKSISSYQIERLRSHSPSQIIVMFDGDSWFDYYRIKKNIPYDVNYIILPKDKDPNDLTYQEMKSIFNKEIEPCLDLNT
jgi:DNA primase